MKMIEATVYLGDGRVHTIVWVADDASDAEIEDEVMDDVRSQIEIEWYEK